jgi:hypothetical protein
MDLAQYFNIMNTTELKQIIKEELTKILNEGYNFNPNNPNRKGYGVSDDEQKIIDSLFKKWKDGDDNVKTTEEYKKLSISAKNKLNGMISNYREESGLY